jgi:hypothetical protein
MKRTLILLCLVLLLAGSARASSGGTYTLSWFSVDGGGGPASAGELTLGGTAGQTDAGVLSGGQYKLAGGFWAGGAVLPILHPLYLPLVAKNSS